MTVSSRDTSATVGLISAATAFCSRVGDTFPPARWAVRVEVGAVSYGATSYAMAYGKNASDTRRSRELHYLHRVDPTVPIEETIGAIAELEDEGGCAAWGCPRAPETMSRQHAVHPIQSARPARAAEGHHAISQLGAQWGSNVVPIPGTRHGHKWCRCVTRPPAHRIAPEAAPGDRHPRLWITAFLGWLV